MLLLIAFSSALTKSNVSAADWALNDLLRRRAELELLVLPLELLPMLVRPMGPGRGAVCLCEVMRGEATGLAAGDAFTELPLLVRGLGGTDIRFLLTFDVPSGDSGGDVLSVKISAAVLAWRGGMAKKKSRSANQKTSRKGSGRNNCLLARKGWFGRS